MWNPTVLIYFFVIHVFHLALCPQVASILWHMSEFPSFLRPNNIPLCVCPKFCLFAHLLMNIWIVEQPLLNQHANSLDCQEGCPVFRCVLSQPASLWVDECGKSCQGLLVKVCMEARQSLQIAAWSHFLKGHLTQVRQAFFNGLGKWPDRDIINDMQSNQRKYIVVYWRIMGSLPYFKYCMFHRCILEPNQF